MQDSATAIRRAAAQAREASLFSEGGAAVRHHGRSGEGRRRLRANRRRPQPCSVTAVPRFRGPAPRHRRTGRRNPERSRFLPPKRRKIIGSRRYSGEGRGRHAYLQDLRFPGMVTGGSCARQARAPACAPSMTPPVCGFPASSRSSATAVTGRNCGARIPGGPGDARAGWRRDGRSGPRPNLRVSIIGCTALRQRRCHSRIRKRCRRQARFLKRVTTGPTRCTARSDLPAGWLYPGRRHDGVDASRASIPCAMRWPKCWA